MLSRTCQRIWSVQTFWTESNSHTKCMFIPISGSHQLKNQRGDSLAVCTFSKSCQWFRYTQKPGRVTHNLEACSAMLISSTDLLKQPNSLAEWSSAILVSRSANLPKHCWATHTLNVCKVILVSGSELLKHRRATHLLDACSAILVSGFDLLKNQRQWLTYWIQQARQWFGSA